MIADAVEFEFAPTPMELRGGATTAMIYARSMWVLIGILAVCEFLLFGLSSHSVVVGIVVALACCALLWGLLILALNSRMKPFRAPTRISLTTEELRVTRAETDCRYKLTYFRKWVVRNDIYVLLGRSERRLFVVVPGRAVQDPDRLSAILSAGIGPASGS